MNARNELERAVRGEIGGAERARSVALCRLSCVTRTETPMSLRRVCRMRRVAGDLDQIRAADWRGRDSAARSSGPAPWRRRAPTRSCASGYRACCRRRRIVVAITPPALRRGHAVRCRSATSAAPSTCARLRQRRAERRSSVGSSTRWMLPRMPICQSSPMRLCTPSAVCANAGAAALRRHAGHRRSSRPRMRGTSVRRGRATAAAAST